MIELQQAGVVFNPGTYSEVKALDTVDLTIHKEEFVVIIGANGSGKSTLLNVIAGSQDLSAGTILLAGNDVTKKKEYERSKYIARIFQNPLLGTAPDLSIIDNFRLASIRTKSKLLRTGINDAFKKTVQERVSTLGMNLEDKLQQPIGSLSGGQRQALTLLMAVMDDTQILLLDEPTAALDPRSSEILMRLADQIIKEYRLTGVLVTHNLKDAAQYGTRVLQMAAGKVFRDVSAAEKQALKSTEIISWFDV